ncbi:MFS transporter [Falsibacillus pallidus]|uniref:Na+/melibiose symporter-like transporter n=1 Tax=Falsibacillus pallidus TaxID=493781 RepID=A0A370GNX4_9BACI|nr:MFS transporter [Falsibacillus pallidus]RDI45438.1 Na+/melibiose symporter-like transporter [Falsibacillus pallidus]
MIAVQKKKGEASIFSKKQPSIWQNANFIILLFSGAVLAFGSKIYELALPLILYHVTNSPVVMSLMKGIEFLPNLLLAMFIGVFVDRSRKKAWSLWTVFLQIIILFVLFFSMRNGTPPLILFYVCGFFLMTCSYAFFNGRASIVKLALPTEMLTTANASFNFIFTFIGIMGPAITGLILMFSSLNSGILLTAVSFSIAFVILQFLKFDEAPSLAAREGFWREFKEGWIELYRNQTLWLITITVIFMNSTAGMVDTTIVFYAKDVMKLSDAELGLLLSFAGIGGLLGSLAIGRIRHKWRTGVIVTMSTLLTGLTYLMLFTNENYAWTASAILLNGFLGTISSVCIWTFRQESTPHHLIGRISGITGSVFKLSMPFAIFASGWISEISRPEVVFLIAFAGNLIIFLFCRFSALWKK